MIEKLSHRNEPVITVADKRVKRCVEEIKEDIQVDIAKKAKIVVLALKKGYGANKIR